MPYAGVLQNPIRPQPLLWRRLIERLALGGVVSSLPSVELAVDEAALAIFDRFGARCFRLQRRRAYLLKYSCPSATC